MRHTVSSNRRTPDEQRVFNVFEAISRQYDFMNSVMSLGRHKAWRSLALNELGIKPGEVAIDICCGTCDLTIALAKQVGVYGRVVGLDFSPQMLRIGEAKCRRQQITNVQLMEGNALALPFADDIFDCATMAFALRNVNDISRALTEMKRVVKPGGKVLALDISHPEHPLLRRLYYCYLYRVLPAVAGWLVDRREEYTWLSESLQGFPDSNCLVSIFSSTGLIRIERHLLLGGIAALHIGCKP